MRFCQLIHRSACSGTLALTRTPVHPSHSTSSVHIRQQRPKFQSPCSTSATSAAIFAAAALMSNMTFAHADAALSPSPVSDTGQPNLDTFSISFQPSAEIPISSKSPNASLFEKVADADPNAVQTLSRMIANPSNHVAFLDEKVLPALLAGLSAAKHKGSPARPVQLAILRILADLAQHNPSHSQFSDPGLSRALSPLLSDFAQSSAEPWSHWLKRQLPFSSSASSNSVTLTTTESLWQPNQLPPADLDIGIIYHSLRCVANIARHSHLHEVILSTPLLQHLCKVLWNLHHYPASIPSTSHHYNDVLRLSTMAVSALAKSAPDEVVANSAHVPIIALTVQTEDPTIQSYAAGGIRNLARHPISSKKDQWGVHRELVVAGAADALFAGMQAHALPQTKSFAISSFSDLMTTGHQKAPIIRKRLRPVYDHFADLMVGKNAVVHRATCRSLCNLFDDTENGNIDVMPEEFAHAIAEKCGPFMNLALKNHDLTAVKAICAMCSSSVIARRMVDKGLLELLRDELKRARGEYWDECTNMLGRLAKAPDFRQLIGQRGILRDVLNRPCLERDGARTSAFLADMARHEEYRVDIAHGGLRVLMTSATSKDTVAVREGARALFNLSLDGFTKVMVSQGGGMIPLINAAKRSDKDARRYAIGAIAEISDNLQFATKLVEADIVSVLLKGAREDVALERNVARCFAQMSQLTEVHGSLAKSGAAEWLASMISSNGGRGEHYGEVMLYSAIAICNIAYSPGITRTVLLEKGIIHTLSALASSGMGTSLVLHAAKQALANIRGKDKPSMIPTEGISKQADPA